MKPWLTLSVKIILPYLFLAAIFMVIFFMEIDGGHRGIALI